MDVIYLAGCSTVQMVLVGKYVGQVYRDSNFGKQVRL